MPADPLAPPMPVQVGPGFMARETGVSDKPEVCLVARIGKGSHQSSNATGDPTSSGVPVGAFEGEDMELHGRTLQHSRVGSPYRPQ